jgi:hemerythrin-like domain-containing protein
MPTKSSKSKASKPDAVSLLTEDHKRVQKIFKEFEKVKDEESDEVKAEMVQTACHELTVHTQLEEEIFYPAMREGGGDEAEDLIDEATVEHASAKQLISELEGMEPGDELYDAKFTVLGEYVNHHIKEEQDEIFPKAKKAKLDLEELGEQMLQLKEQLMGSTEESSTSE